MNFIEIDNDESYIKADKNILNEKYYEYIYNKYLVNINDDTKISINRGFGYEEYHRLCYLNNIDLAGNINICNYCESLLDIRKGYYCNDCNNVICDMCYSNMCYSKMLKENKCSEKLNKCNTHNITRCIGKNLVNCDNCDKCGKRINYGIPHYSDFNNDYDLCIECYTENDNKLIYCDDDFNCGSLYDYISIINFDYNGSIKCNFNEKSKYYRQLMYMAYDDHGRSGCFVKKETDEDIPKILEEYKISMSDEDDDYCPLHRMMLDRGMCVQYG